MKLPFRKSEPLPKRMLHSAAAGAGVARLAIRQRTLHPHRMERRSRNPLKRAMHLD